MAMLLKIDFKPEDVIFQEGGRIVLKVWHYGPNALGAHLVTVPGETMEDFHQNKPKSGKSVLVGVMGGLKLV